MFRRTIYSIGPQVSDPMPIRTILSSGMSDVWGQGLGINHDPFKFLESEHSLGRAHVRLQLVDPARALSGPFHK
jgi:hypothetical protein